MSDHGRPETFEAAYARLRSYLGGMNFERVSEEKSEDGHSREIGVWVNSGRETERGAVFSMDERTWSGRVDYDLVDAETARMPITYGKHTRSFVKRVG